jgi:O-methyltransferase
MVTIVWVATSSRSRAVRALSSRLPTTTKAAVVARMRQIGFEPAKRAAFDEEFLDFYRRCEDYTETSIERMCALYDAMRYLAAAGVPGDYVECGVWRGGSSMLAGLCALQNAQTDMRFWLYDTFAGMTRPTPEDGSAALAEWNKGQRDDHHEWCYAPLDDVRRNIQSTGLPTERFELVEGVVEETIPRQAPERISLLRLDTDWYASTKHELEHLYPRLERGGVLLIDDYGFWQGARQAVEEYLREHQIVLLLSRIDDTGRVAVKP